MAYCMSVARDGFCCCRIGMMLLLLHEVSMRDFSGLIKHPRSAPSCFRVSRKNFMSTCGIVHDRSSTQANR